MLSSADSHCDQISRDTVACASLRLLAPGTDLWLASTSSSLSSKDKKNKDDDDGGQSDDDDEGSVHKLRFLSEKVQRR